MRQDCRIVDIELIEHEPGRVGLVAPYVPTQVARLGSTGARHPAQKRFQSVGPAVLGRQHGDDLYAWANRPAPLTAAIAAPRRLAGRAREDLE